MKFHEQIKFAEISFPLPRFKRWIFSCEKKAKRRQKTFQYFSFQAECLNSVTETKSKTFVKTKIFSWDVETRSKLF